MPITGGGAAAAGHDISARVYHSADQNIPHDTLTILAFDSERFDTDGIHDPVTNNSRLTCQTAGKYIISATWSWAMGGTGGRHCQLLLNGTIVLARSYKEYYAQSSDTLTTIYDLDVGDYLELQAYQNGGGTEVVEAAPNLSPEFMMAKILG